MLLASRVSLLRRRDSGQTSLRSTKVNENISGPPVLRAGNRALEQLTNFGGPSAKEVGHFVRSCAKFADILYSDARNAADRLLTQGIESVTALNEETPLDRATALGLLTNSVFDLQLTVCFDEFEDYFKSSEAASLYVDSLVYQATGAETTVPSGVEARESSGFHRGIAKYQVGKGEMPHIGDIAGWMFSKEFALLVTGGADIAIVLLAVPFSMRIRLDTLWTMKSVLYDVSVTDEDRIKADFMIAKCYEEVTAMINNLSGMES